MEKKFNFGALLLSILVGIVFVNLLAWLTGPEFADAFFPGLALLVGFTISGFTIGIMSKDVTITEPGIGAIVVSLVTYFIIQALDLRGFQGVWASDWILIFLNAIILTFVGAWLGEKFQQGKLEDHHTTDSFGLDWSWIVAGAFMGIIVSIVLVVLLDLIIGHHPSAFILPFVIALIINGLVIGLKSPGVTILEAGYSGLFTIIANLNIIRLTLMDNTEIGVEYIIGGLVLGFVMPLLGAFIGEKLQGSDIK